MTMTVGTLTALHVAFQQINKQNKKLLLQFSNYIYSTPTLLFLFIYLFMTIKLKILYYFILIK